MKLTLTSSIPIFLSLLRPASAGGWLTTCGAYDMYEQGTELMGSCEDGSGGIVESYLDLNSCLVNINGVIYWEPNGGFGGSCSYNGNLCWTCRTDNGGENYQCQDLGKSFLAELKRLGLVSNVLTDAWVINDYGNLVCNGPQ
jgi:hypothetical protein